MYINEVLYHIDEDYKKWCDTIDMVCEELLLEEKDDWFFNMTPDEQEKYLKDHPNSEKAKELKKKRDSMPQKDVDIKDTGNVDDGDVDGDDIPDEEDESITLPDTVGDLKNHIRSMQDAVGADVADIAMAFKEPSVYNTVKAIGGSISGSSKIIMGSLRTVGKSLKVGASALHDTSAFQKLKGGVIKVDEFMQKNKALATLSAVAVSGLAIGQWLRMSFSGDIESDFDLTIIPQAFAGEAGFKELIATPDGIKGMGLLSAGMATGGLPIWMGGATGLALALTYSGLQSAGQTEKGKELKDKMVKWAQSMGDTIEKGAKAVDKKLGIQQESTLFIEIIINMKEMKYEDVEEKLKPIKYKKVKIFKSGWDNIALQKPPSPDSKEAKAQMMKTVSEVEDATDQEKQEYINSDKDSSYYIKEYMDDNDLKYNENMIEFIEDQCVPVIRHYKNTFNYPRPYQLAEKYKVKLNKLKTGTASTPSYPSGHTVQPYVVANFYGKKYPEHKKNLRIMADKTAYGRINAGLHYPMDYSAGIKLADSLNDYMDFDYELKAVSYTHLTLPTKA